MTRASCLRGAAGVTAILAVAWAVPCAAASTYDPPRGSLTGFIRGEARHVDVAPNMHVVIELEPKDRQLEDLAAAIIDPASPLHRSVLTKEQFAARFGRPPAEADALAAFLRAHGATDVYESRTHLVVSGDMSLDDAHKALGATFDVFERGPRLIVAPVGPVTLPVGNIRAVRGIVSAFEPRLADIPLPNDFRGAWFPPTRFRDGYDAAPGGGAGMRIALIEDSSDRFDIGDLTPFMSGADSGLDMLFGFNGSGQGGPPGGGKGHGPPPPQVSAADSFGTAIGADASRVHERVILPPSPDQVCGRDDRGQEAAMDVDAALTLAPLATIDVRYDRVCVRGGEGVVPLQRTLDDDPAPDVIVLPFDFGPVNGPTADAWGPIPIPLLEAAVRGIPVIVAAGDDGSLGYRVADADKPGLAYPCVLPVVICAGGTQLGLRTGLWDEGPWNDGTHATGGGISWDPRPSWQDPPARYEFSKQFGPANHRMVPDVSADASGHLEIFWHGYAVGGVGGTSESAAIVAAQIATINSAVPKAHRITGPGDLYVLARAHPDAFRHVDADNDRGYHDNTLHPKPLPPPLGYHGVLPSPPPQVLGCGPDVQSRGCDVRTEGSYNAVTGIGSLKEKSAIDALKPGGA